MSNTREKLIELINEVQACGSCKKTSDFDDRYWTLGIRKNAEIADHLIANGVTVQKWIWVKKKLPEDGVRVFAYCGWNGDTYIAVRRNKKWYLVWDNKTELLKISHWMPLPTDEPREGEYW